MFYLTWVRERDLRKEREVLALKKTHKTAWDFPFLTSAGKQQWLVPVRICQSNEKSIILAYLKQDT